MALALDNDLRAYLESQLAVAVSAYAENKLKRFGLYRRTTIHTGTTVAQRTFGDKIKCIDTLLRESGKLLVSKLPITALSRDETYEMHLKDILKAEWSNHGILVVDSGGQRHKDFYISAFLSVADVRTSVQKIYHKSRLEMYEELQNAIKIMPSVNGRRPCCSRNDREELYRLNCFSNHMALMKELFCVESGLDPRSFQKNEDGPYRYDPSYSPPDARYIAENVPYGPWEHLVQSITFLVSDEASCMRMVHEYYTSNTGKFDFLVTYLNENASRGKAISDVYHHPAMAVLELLRVAGPDINLLCEGSAQNGGSLCSIDFFFQEVGVNLIATITYFLQKMVLFGGTINGETSLKEFFYPESGIYRFKPGEGLARCTRYVMSDLGAAFPSTTEGNELKFSVVSRRRFQIIALLSKFFTATRAANPESSVPTLEKQSDLRGSSLDFDPDDLCLPQSGQGPGSGSGSGSGDGHHRYDMQGQGQGQGQRLQGIYSPLNTPNVCGYHPRHNNNSNTNNNNNNNSNTNNSNTNDSNTNNNNTNNSNNNNNNNSNTNNSNTNNSNTNNSNTNNSNTNNNNNNTNNNNTNNNNTNNNNTNNSNTNNNNTNNNNTNNSNTNSNINNTSHNISNNNISTNTSTSAFEGFKVKEKHLSDPNLNRREEETRNFFHGGKTSLPVSSYNHPLYQNARSSISNSTLNNSNNNNNNNNNSVSTNNNSVNDNNNDKNNDHSSNSSDKTSTNNIDSNKNSDSDNSNSSSNGCTENISSEHFFRMNDDLTNFQRIQNFSNFQLLSRPPPPSQRAIAVVLASIKDFGQPIGTPLNSDGGLVSAMADSDEFQEAGANSSSSNSNITEGCVVHEKHTHTNTQTHRTDESAFYNTGVDIRNSKGDSRSSSADQNGGKRQNTYRLPIRQNIGRTTMQNSDREDDRLSTPRTPSEFNPLPNPTSPTSSPSHPPPRDIDYPQGGSAQGESWSRSEEDLIAQMNKKQKQQRHSLSKD